MIDLRGRGALVATGVAVGLHVILFLGATKANDRSELRRRTAPFVGYNTLPVSGDDTLVSANAVRILNSPVLFSLPSSVGFSRFLRINDVETKKSFVQQVYAEAFLEVDPLDYLAQKSSDVTQLRVLSPSRKLGIPRKATSFKASPVLKLFLLSDALEERLINDPELPFAFSDPTEKAWEVIAQINVSESGRVEHVFLEHPVESKELNQQILLFLYGLRFAPGLPIEGTVELHSIEVIYNAGESL